MDGVFEEIRGRLREVKVLTRQTADGRGFVSFRSFLVEMPFTAGKALSIGKLLAVKTMEENSYLLLEVVDFLPMHYGMLELDQSVPREIREEVMRRVEENWGSEDPNAWIEVHAYPIGYLLEVNGGVKFKKGYVPPLIASTVHVLNQEVFKKFVCEEKGVKIGEIIGEGIPLTVDLRRAINYHIGVFAFTGSGKSNLTSLLIRRALSSLDVKIVVVDISMEYAVLLLDQLLKHESRLVTTERLALTPEEGARRFLRTHVIPEEVADLRDRIRQASVDVYPKMRHLYVPPEEFQYLTYGDLLAMVSAQISDKYTSFAQKPLFGLLLKKLDSFMREKKLSKEDIVDDSISQILDQVEEEARSSGLKESATIFSFLSGLKAYFNEPIQETEDYDIEKLAIEVLDSSPSSSRLFVLELPNIDEARGIVASLINEVMSRRKRLYSATPVLFVIDEAQEFIPFDTRQKDKSESSSNAIEKLLRHGRKYHLHALISTQRLAYLNTNVLQQLHTYFISTLPRPYDRQLVAETFGINDALMDRTLDLEVGQWLLVSFKAALPHDVPVFFTADNNLEELRRGLNGS
ncbi:MAG: hypothetical protein ASUL_01310 [Candidatus Aramenus sulfurataquae]|uniref:Helicase HerA central domain-containing protein n=1 Tax=Candidatus Aramenus sulfurataquae TaxID=1326980 RepID=W7L8Z1_9CREN|nr:MAG: hypothetical protein ASUL_01310 [Candidatus Aramenus sulfurataquae]